MTILSPGQRQTIRGAASIAFAAVPEWLQVVNELCNAIDTLDRAARTAVEAGRAYDRALNAAGSQIDAGAAPVFIDSDDLDTLYAAWLSAINALARLVEVPE